MFFTVVSWTNILSSCSCFYLYSVIFYIFFIFILRLEANSCQVFFVILVFLNLDSKATF